MEDHQGSVVVTGQGAGQPESRLRILRAIGRVQDLSDRKHKNLPESESSWHATTPNTDRCRRGAHDFLWTLRKEDAIPVAETVSWRSVKRGFGKNQLSSQE